MIMLLFTGLLIALGGTISWVQEERSIKCKKFFISIGTRSLLFGVHQFLWHPFTVWLAWKELYGPPSWKEIVCIAIHDIGYWGKKNMDGGDGLMHPEAGAKLAGQMFGEEYKQLVLGHSRSYSKIHKSCPSKLCWADKLSIQYEPWWIYLPRAWASGELKEYRAVADHMGFIDKNISHRTWFNKLKESMVEQAKEEGRKQYRVNSTHYGMIRMPSVLNRYLQM